MTLAVQHDGRHPPKAGCGHAASACPVANSSIRSIGGRFSVHGTEISGTPPVAPTERSEEHTSELQSQSNLVCRLLLEKKKHRPTYTTLCHQRRAIYSG